MHRVIQLIAVLTLLFSQLLAHEFTLSEKCSKCQMIAQQFKDGLIRTAKSNFGGGNTDWEEKKLKGFAASETRLVEIMESMSSCSSDKFCSMFLESQEDAIEKWWFDSADLLRSAGTSEEGATQLANKFSEFLCVKETAVCCPNNTYGSACTPCPTKFSGMSCSGHGTCDGDGTRSGTGKCRCSQGYVGDECASCGGGYFSTSTNEEESVSCTACETNCEECKAAGPGQCSQCSTGWLLTKPEGSEVGYCFDINECESPEGSPCKTPSTYCANVPGSYKCVSCDSSCDSAGCTGSGPAVCIGECVPGYVKKDGRCEDIDECAEAETAGTKLCGEAQSNETSPDPICINTVGSFRCGCSAEGFEYGEGVCMPIKPPPPPPEENEEDGKKKYTKKERRDTNKPMTNKSTPNSKVAGSLETDFSLIHFCAVLIISIIVISFLSSKPRPWPAVAAVLLVLTAIYVYYYVVMHEPKKGADSGTASTADSRFAQKASSKSSRRS